MSRKIVHVIGTGTIGEPLIGLLCDYQEQLGIDEITFHKIAEIEEGEKPHGYATIDQHQNQTVQGLLIGLNRQQISRLDRSEGVNANPPHYTKEEVVVQTDDGVEHSAFTYIAGSQRVDKSLRPANWYLERIVQGAKENGLDEWYVEKLESFGG